MHVINLDVTNGSEDALLQIDTILAGTVRSRAAFGPTETIFNQDAQDLDFRVESSGNANMLFVDGGTNRVGIGTASPLGSLHVSGATTSSGILITNATSSLNIGTIANHATWQGSGSSDDFVVSGYGARNLILGTNGAERMRITSAGNVLVGGTAQNGSEKFGILTTGAGAFAHWKSTGTSGDPSVFRLSTGQLSGGIGSGRFITCDDGGADKFFVTGAGVVNATNTSITSISDARLKENVRDLETGLNSVMALKPRRFDWKENQGTNKKDVAGFIAQEVETILPDLIGEWKVNSEDDTIYKSLEMGNMLPTLVKAIQEQQATIEALTTRITALEG